MSRTPFLSFCASLALFVLPLSASAQDEGLIPPPTASYTADQRIESDGEAMEASIIVDGVRQRSEQVMDGAEVITIIRPEEGRSFPSSSSTPV